MSKDHLISAIEFPKEQPRTAVPLDLNEIEMIFGTPEAPKGNVQPDVHLITNERDHGRDTHHDNHPIDGGVNHPTQPLLEPDKEPQKPPLAGPEIDDLDETDSHHTDPTAPFPGIDDGLLEHEDKKPGIHDGDDEVKSNGDPHSHSTHDDGIGTDDGKWLWPSTDEADYPYDLGNRFGEDGRPLSPYPPAPTLPDLNTYQQKKNLAQGMMDLALLSANANQLRYVLESSATHPYFYPSIVFISLSIIFQIAVGVGLIMNSRYNIRDDDDICKADKINNMTVLGIFLITIVNVFITSFSVATPTTTAAVGGVIQAG